MGRYILIAVGVIALLLIIYLVMCRNSFVKLNNKVREAFATMDVYLKKRWDLIPNIIETVKGYTKHESEVLQEVINLRNNAYDNMSSEEKIDTNQKISSGINKIMALAESYPDLKASQNFIDLSQNLASVEDEIASSRKYYNAVIKEYNTKVELFPSNIVAKLFGYSPKTMFEAQEAERENVKVQF